VSGGPVPLSVNKQFKAPGGGVQSISTELPAITLDEAGVTVTVGHTVRCVATDIVPLATALGGTVHVSV